MLHAVESEAREIYSLMTTRKDIFPHIRFDYVQRACRDGRCVYEDGVVIIYQRYKRTVQLGTVRIPAGSVKEAKETAGSGSGMFCKSRWAKTKAPLSPIIQASTGTHVHFSARVVGTRKYCGTSVRPTSI
jgi:hypothetical protein